MLNQGDKFNPKDFALRLHQEITEPDEAWTSASSRVGNPDAAHAAAEARAASSIWREVRARTPERVLRLSFERMSKVRGLKYIIIEEAANISRVGKNQSARNYMLGIMALIEEIGCCAIMIGTHEAAPLFEDAQEILNRSEVLYMRPYSLKIEEDVVAYASMVKAIGSGIPLSHKTLLQDNLDLIALNGGGIFGPTYRFLRQADAERCKTSERVLTEKHLRTASGTARNHTSLWSDIDAFNRLADARRPVSLERFVGPSGTKRLNGSNND
ncbi:hypothetical protein [Stenotrophomonas sp. ISL-67]|uniref:hypothetical protein n=1 Tax=Stenotrophomonas sp. ISL-67 TaxID=2819171 RepID=UPI001BE53514|nr:hypothetical protein [Stenotrophomonas sp. ISL-67]